VTTKIRVSGLQGIGGVVRKIENEDLAENIWSPTHMDKIIPSLLYNIQIGDYKAGQGRSQTPDLSNLGDQDCKSPLQIAEDTFRKLMGRAGFLSIRAVMRPILQHLDIHQMWTPSDFAEHTFQMVMFSIQQQVNYIIIEMLMAHLEKKSGDTMVRVGIARNSHGALPNIYQQSYRCKCRSLSTGDYKCSVDSSKDQCGASPSKQRP